MKLLIVGFSEPGHMGNYLCKAAKKLGLDYLVADAIDAQASTRIVRSFYWHLCGKRPVRLRSFSKHVLDISRTTQRDVVLTTGCAPIDQRHIEYLRGLGARVINYSTDDPWNPNHRAAWFLKALPAY